MMTSIEFQKKVVGTRYLNRGYDFDGFDCFGLCYLYYKHVKGFTPTISDEYHSHEDFSKSFCAQLHEWESVERPKEGDCLFVCFNGDIPMHCGIMISKNQVLHADKNQCMIWNMQCMTRYLRRFYKLGRRREWSFIDHAVKNNNRSVRGYSGYYWQKPS